MTTLKKHPIAWTIYALFMIGWIVIGYMAYADFSRFGDGHAMLTILYRYMIFGFLPYLIINFLIYEFLAINAKVRPFYALLTKFIAGSIPVIIITGVILNFLTSAF